MAGRHITVGESREKEKANEKIYIIFFKCNLQ